MFTESVRIVSSVFLLLVIAVGLMGNLLVCLVVRNRVEMRTATNLILLNLAIADFLGCLVNMPVLFITFWNGFEHQTLETLGEIHFVLTVFIGSVICCCHVLLCIDRYDAMKCPFNKRITKKRMKKISLVMWIASLATATLTIGLVVSVQTHWLTLQEEEPHYIAGEILNAIGTFVILAVLSLMIYSSCVVRQEISSHNNNMRISLGHATLDRERRFRKVTAVLVTGFTLTCLPWVVFRLVYDITGHQDKISYMVSYSILYTSHTINPLVYAGLMRNFQKAMKQILKRFLSKLCCGIKFSIEQTETSGRGREERTSAKALQRSVNSLATIHPLNIDIPNANGIQ